MTTIYQPERVLSDLRVAPSDELFRLDSEYDMFRSEIAQELTHFDPINLAEMDSVALLNRNDTKYLCSIDKLHQILPNLAQDYRVLEIDQVRLHPYQTLYFDSADFVLYLMHHAGRSNKYKVRSRYYFTSDSSFLEVKHKTSDDRTNKQRLPTETLVTEISSEEARFLERHVPFSSKTLEAKLWNSFSRITLVGKQHPERVTIDLGLSYNFGERSLELSEVVVVEVKQDGIQRRSPFILQMRSALSRPMGFSKYCIGVALLYPHIKHNNFKPKLQQVSKLMKGSR